MALTQPIEPLMALSNPKFPFQKIITDFFNMHGKMYIIYTGWYTGWVKVSLMSFRKARTAVTPSGIGSVHTVHQRKTWLIEDHHLSRRNITHSSTTRG